MQPTSGSVTFVNSGSEGYSRQDSDVSTTMTTSTSATTPEEEPSTQREKKDQRSPPRGRLPSSVSDSSLVSALHRNSKGTTQTGESSHSDGSASPLLDCQSFKGIYIRLIEC